GPGDPDWESSEWPLCLRPQHPYDPVKILEGNVLDDDLALAISIIYAHSHAQSPFHLALHGINVWILPWGCAGLDWLRMIRAIHQLLQSRYRQALAHCLFSNPQNGFRIAQLQQHSGLTEPQIPLANIVLHCRRKLKQPHVVRYRFPRHAGALADLFLG